MGANPRELGIPGDRELVGRGVAYCAACDGMFYKGKTVVVVGGGNTAAADALLLSRIAQKVIPVSYTHLAGLPGKNTSFREDLLF